MNTNYAPYAAADLRCLTYEPWEVSDRPYMLHASYALYNLFDIVCCNETDDDSASFTPNDMWGLRIEKRILDRLVRDIQADFNDAATNRKPIEIWGRSYTIRKINSYDHNRLHNIFSFPIENGEYIITKEGVLNLAGATPLSLKSYEISQIQSKQNRTYLRQIIKLAEDDINNGWDRLTDMEIIYYCWAQFYNKHQVESFVIFKNEYKDYFYVSDKDILSCLNEKSTLCEKPIGMYAMSAEKIQKWNNAHNQSSEAVKIPEHIADNYWYDVALKSSFIPLDLQ